MRRLSALVVLVTANVMWIGCGGAAGPANVESAARSPIAEALEAPSSGAEALAPTVEQPELAGLPAAPWANEAPLGAQAVPAPLVSAWEHAENRAHCAPLAPTSLGVGDGARPRIGELEGGWAVEFDRRGLPGIGTDGETCARCGRGAFGIAGTNLIPEDLVSEESDSDHPEPSFADGSYLSVEPPVSSEDVAAAIITVRGQGCVYQVWSFLGEEHVRQLVDSLRLVDVATLPSQMATR